jgi:N-acetylmuramoyl-L-alanine amidase
MKSPPMRPHLGMILLFAVALPLLHGAAWGERLVTEKPAPSADKPKASACDHHAFRAVIDVGHTQALGGATSARGIYEYEFNLRLAKQVVHKLTAAGFEKTVLLITSEAPRAGLFQRSSRANAMGADLFLSIHHDSVPDPMLEKWTYDGVEHTYNDRFPGHSIFISNDNPQSGRSLEFASLLGAQLKSRGLKYTPHYTERFMGHRRREIVDAANGVYRYDQLIVLRSTHMPAVLLEAGSIINRKEELELAKPERVALVADAALDAVESYCDAHGHRIAEAPPHPDSGPMWFAVPLSWGTRTPLHLVGLPAHFYWWRSVT